MTSASFTLPWPPSVNRYWRSVNGRNILARDGREYRSLAIESLLLQGVRGVRSGPIYVRIIAHLPDNRRRDIDNILKAPLDAMTHAGVYGDDSQVERLSIEKARPDGNPRLVVEVIAL